MTLADDVARDRSGRVLLDDFATEKSMPLEVVHNVNNLAAIDTIRRAELGLLFIIGQSQIAKSENRLSTTRLYHNAPSTTP